MTRTAPLLVLVLALTAAACSGSDSSTSTTSTTLAPSTTVAPTTTIAGTTTVVPEVDGTPVATVPGDQWSRTSLGEAGFDDVAFARAIALADEVDSHCFVVVRDGEIVHEQYGPDSGPDADHEVFSVTKSVTAAIVGAAVTAGHLDVAEPAATYIDEWTDTDSSDVTIRQLLQNTSGRFYDPVPDLVGLGGKPDMTQHSVDLDQQAEPDTVWAYNQSAIQTLHAVLEQSTGVDPEAFAQDHLFEPIGMTVSFPRDPAGNIPLFAGLQAGCLDLARFGLLSLRDGDWGGQQVIDPDFMAAATTGTEINRAYGYLYWSNAEAGTWGHTDPRRDRTEAFWPDLPLDVFGANGLGSQFSMVIPDEDIIVVRIGPPSGVQGYDGILANDLPAAVLAASTG